MPTYVIHGVVEEREPRKFVHRNYLDRQLFESFLAAHPRFGSWNPASDSDVLTVDDATRAGADACRIARMYGHNVTFFINPGVIESREPYFFALLDPLLDTSSGHTVFYEGMTYDLSDWVAARAFRRAVKRRIVFQSDASIVRGNIETLARLLDAYVPEPPPHLATIDRAELEELSALGVQIEGHGWTHVNPAHMDSEQFTQHVERSRRWLHEWLGVDSRWYAVPFGECEPSSVASDCSQPDVWFLADSDRPPGPCGGNVWNRVTLTLAETPR